MNRIKAFLMGMSEFRLSFTHSYDDQDENDAYDWGREWDHRLTLTVFPFFLGGIRPFDGSRCLAFRFANGYTSARNVDGADLTSVLYAAI